jgi:signal transduction histidine kinase
MTSQITDKNILRVLIGGFSLVIILLLLAAFISIRNVQSIKASAARLVSEQSVTLRLIDEIQREQVTLNAVYYMLGRKPERLDRVRILEQVNDAEQAISHVADQAKGDSDEKIWDDLRQATREFSMEARRLLALQDAPTLSSQDLLARHEKVIEVISKLIASGQNRSLAAERMIDTHSKKLISESTVLLGACLLLAMVCAVLTVRITANLFRQMEWQAGELSRVSWHMLETQETTARRFSHELHDELGQSLTAVKANLIALNNAARPLNGRVDDCIALVDEAIRNVRELSQLLRPTILDDFGLEAGLRWLSEGFTQRTGIEVAFSSDLEERPIEETETHLFRIAQEAMTNVARHSGASKVIMSLRAKDGSIHLDFSDNGRGFAEPDDPSPHGLGMIGMRARARSTGGGLKITSRPGAGVQLEAWAPAAAKGNESKNSHLVS